MFIIGRARQKTIEDVVHEIGVSGLRSRVRFILTTAMNQMKWSVLPCRWNAGYRGRTAEFHVGRALHNQLFRYPCPAATPPTRPGPRLRLHVGLQFVPSRSSGVHHRASPRGEHEQLRLSERLAHPEPLPPQTGQLCRCTWRMRVRLWRLRSLQGISDRAGARVQQTA